MSIKIEKFIYEDVSEEDFVQFNSVTNQIRKEKLPDDPPTPLELTRQQFLHFPDHLEIHFWRAMNEVQAEMVGYTLLILSLNDNTHLGQFEINVVKEYRGQGIGRKFLEEIARLAEENNRRILISNTTGKIPAGEAFLSRIGGERGMEAHNNQLVIAEVNRGLIQDWEEKAKDRAVGFELGLWEGPYPDEDIDHIVALHDLFNQQPLGDLDVEDFEFTADMLRQQEKRTFTSGYERWTMYVREIKTGNFAGYTEVLWNPARPYLITQDMTGVFPQYRNKGIGRWLKAAMLNKIISERPQAKFVRTGNADSNAPMLKINNEMGFKPYSSECIWQVETAKVRDYLNS